MSVTQNELIYDGECGFCLAWITHFFGDKTNTIHLTPFQTLHYPYKRVSMQAFKRAVHYVDGENPMHVGAAAVFKSLSDTHKAPFFWRLYQKLPLFRKFSEWLYMRIANNRYLLGAWARPSEYRHISMGIIKGVGGAFFIAFLSLYSQLIPLFGQDGIMPIGLFYSDISLKIGCILGGFSSVMMMVSRRCVFFTFFSWCIYLSFVNMGSPFLSFQWDVLLLELGFLCLFLNPTKPSILVIWAFRVLLFRLVFASGLVKLLSGDSSWRDLQALSVHYLSQPIPHVISWYAHQLPLWFHKVSVALTLGIESGVSFFIVGIKPLRRLAFFCTVSLMGFIFITGNYTFFNMLVIVLCLSLLDDDSLPRWMKRFHFKKYKDSLVGRLSPFIAGGLIVLGLSLECSRFLPMIRNPFKPLHTHLRPLHLVNGYGLFAHMTSQRVELDIQGSYDGKIWESYLFKYKPGDTSVAPQWVQPHQPRLDWQMWFAALGTIRQNVWLQRFIVQLLQGNKVSTSLLAHNPFEKRPPHYIRVKRYRYTYTTFEEKEKTGEWWKREPLADYLPVVSLR